MNREKRRIVYFFLALIDAALIVGCYYLAAWIYMGSLSTLGGLNELDLDLPNGGGLALLVIYAGIVVSCYALSRVYGSIYTGRIRKMANRILVINTVGIVIFAALMYALHLDDVSRMTLLIFYLLSTVVVMLKGWLTIQFFYRLRKGSQKMQRVLVVGCSKLAKSYAKTIGVRDSRLEHVIGYVTPTGADCDPAALAQECPLLRECLGSVGELDGILSAVSVDEMVIALEAGEYGDAIAVMAMADKHGTMLTLVPFYSDIIPRRPTIDTVDEVKLVNMRSMPLSDPMNAAFKRTADIVLSVAVIGLLWWFMLLVALGVKLTTPGSVLFKQERIGRNNKPFMMLKFRSMPEGRESRTAWTTDDDPRKTRFGSFIRKFSIDELPQFFNVLAGDMSIIGPRPEIPYYVDKYRKSISRYMLRHQVRPGISGWAQINGFRGNTSVAGRIYCDIWYIDNWTPLLDVKIIFKTIFGGFMNTERVNKRA